MAIELTCIICPNGCKLTVDDDLNVTGNRCPRGVSYGKQEVTDPRRTLTSTVRIDSEILPVCPVKSKDPLPKGKVLKAMEIVNKTHIKAPVHIGDVVISNVVGTGVDIVATREILE